MSDSKDGSEGRAARREKKETAAAPKARPGPSPATAKRLDNIETIRSGTKLQPVASPKQQKKAPSQTKEEMAQNIATLHDVTQVMTAANISEEDLWEGRTDLFPIILHYGPELIAAAMASEDFCVLEIKFPTLPEFNGITHKLYKCDPFWTVHHTVGMVCKRFGITDYKSFSLATHSGFSLQDSEPLATFGLGSLLPRWQLVLQQREGKAITRMDTIKTYKASTIRPRAAQAVSNLSTIGEESKTALGTSSTGSSSSLSSESPKSTLKKKTTHRKTGSATPNPEERFPLLLLLDSTVFKYKSQRVQVRAVSTIADLLDAISRAHSIPVNTASTLVVSTLSGTLLDRSGILCEYGLGKRFQRWQLRIHVSSNDSSTAPTPLKSSGKYAWVQIEEANVQPGEAKKIILELDKKTERLRRQAVKDASSTSSSGSGATSVAAKAYAKMETELNKLKEAKLEAEKATAAADLKLETQLKTHLKQKADFEATISRLRDERDLYRSKARDLDKQLTAEKAHFDSQVLAHQTSLNETLKRLSTGKSRKSAASAFDEVPKSSSSSALKDSKSKRSSDDDSLAQAQAELQVAHSDLTILKKELEHQKQQFEASLLSVKSESERAKSETLELRTRVAELDEASLTSKSQVETLSSKVRDLIASLAQEKIARREALEKISDLEQKTAMDEEALAESIQSRVEQEYEQQQAELLANNRELYAAIEEMKQQLIETGKQRDELRSVLDTVGIVSPRPEDALNVPVATQAAPPPPPAPAPAPAPPPIAGLGASTTTKPTRSKNKPQREDSVFLGLSLASRIEQGRSKLKTTEGPQKRNYQSDLEAALRRRFMAMTNEDLEELDDDEDSDSDGAFDEDEIMSSANSGSRALFDLKL